MEKRKTGFGLMRSVLVVAVCVFSFACEEQSKGPRKGGNPTPKPSATPTVDPGDPGNPNGNNPGQPVTPGGDASYMQPLQRPADVQADEIVFTPVYIDGGAWFKTCVAAKAQGKIGNVGCTISAGSHLSKDAPLFELNRSVRWKPQSTGQAVELEFYTYRPTSTANCSAAGCPGPFAESPALTKVSGSAPETLKCVRSGSVLVFFFDDQADQKVSSDSAFRAGLSAESGAVPSMPFLRNLTDEGLLNAVYSGNPDGGTISERDVRRKFGIDYDEVILQVDLGSGNYTIKGYESCQ